MLWGGSSPAHFWRKMQLAFSSNNSFIFLIKCKRCKWNVHQFPLVCSRKEIWNLVCWIVWVVDQINVFTKIGHVNVQEISKHKSLHWLFPQKRCRHFLSKMPPYYQSYDMNPYCIWLLYWTNLSPLYSIPDTSNQFIAPYSNSYICTCNW